MTVNNSDIQLEDLSLKSSLKREYALNRIIGKSEVIAKIIAKVNQISLCDVNVLISGESGTGKELFARAIHYLSKRASKPFIPVNCGAIPENLFENELFGHKKGAYTSAEFQQIGLVQNAEGGTLFLDEIGVINPNIQVKLLRLLQEKEYKPLGDSKSHKADIRIIAATNKDLKALIREGSFREDFFYRLDVISLHIPPLRERKKDIPILVKHFIDKYSNEFELPVKNVSDEAMDSLISYSWPGNIRELENQIQKMIVLSTSPIINDDHIQSHIKGADTRDTCTEDLKTAKKKVISYFEENYLKSLLTEQRGNVVASARKAGKSRTAFWNLLKKYSISPKQYL